MVRNNSTDDYPDLYEQVDAVIKKRNRDPLNERGFGIGSHTNGPALEVWDEECEDVPKVTADILRAARRAGYVVSATMTKHDGIQRLFLHDADEFADQAADEGMPDPEPTTDDVIETYVEKHSTIVDYRRDDGNPVQVGDRLTFNVEFGDRKPGRSHIGPSAMGVRTEAGEYLAEHGLELDLRWLEEAGSGDNDYKAHDGDFIVGVTVVERDE